MNTPSAPRHLGTPHGKHSKGRGEPWRLPVVIPALLRKLTNGVERVTATGRNVGQIIDALEKSFPGIKDQLIENGELKLSVAVSIDGEIGNGGVLDPIRDDSEVYFVPALSGGC